MVCSWGGEEGTLPFRAGGVCPDVLGGPLFLYEGYAVALGQEVVPSVEVHLHVGGDWEWLSSCLLRLAHGIVYATE